MKPIPAFHIMDVVQELGCKVSSKILQRVLVLLLLFSACDDVAQEASMKLNDPLAIFIFSLNKSQFLLVANSFVWRANGVQVDSVRKGVIKLYCSTKQEYTYINSENDSFFN